MPRTSRRAQAEAMELSPLKQRDANVATQSAIDPEFANYANTIAHIFQDVQKSTTSHKKHGIRLWSIHKQAYEKDMKTSFDKKFCAMLNQILPVKKSEPAGEKVAKFVTHYVEYIATQGAPKAQDNEDVDMDIDMDIDEEDESSEHFMAHSFIEMLFAHLLQGVDAKNKAVRFRVCQLLASIVVHLGEIDDDLFQELRAAFVRRIHDKESTIRLQAVLGLARLQGTDDEDEPEPITELLLNALQNDSKADIRRAALLNIEKNNVTIPYSLERARDMDAATRRSVYTRILPEIGDFRLLSIGMREKILSWGLNDRDASVKNASVRVFAHGWLENTGNDVLELLERLDVLNSSVAEDAMKALFSQRKDVVNSLEFPPMLWENLTAETVFLARTFAAYCREEKLDDLFEERMPEVTKLGFYLQAYSKFLDREESEEESSVEEDFTLEQLLAIASLMDFSDEIGRRKVFDVIRMLLAKEKLSDSATELSVVVLRKVSLTEREFCEVIGEIISDVHDSVADDEFDDSFHSALSDVESVTGSSRRSSKTRSSIASNGSDAKDKAIHELMINMKCLKLAQCMLENVGCRLKSNMALTSLLDQLIVPAVRSHEAPIRERGLHCLGLCCLLDKDLSLENTVLFMHCFNKGHEALQVEAIHIICDILVSHGGSILSVNSGIDTEMIVKMHTRALDLGTAGDVQVAAVQSLSKLLLAGILTDPEGMLLERLTTLYDDEGTMGNSSLRQTLSYCLPVLNEHMNEIKAAEEKEAAEETAKEEDDVEVSVQVEKEDALDSDEGEEVDMSRAESVMSVLTEV
ncbi:nuclear condensing complex subunit [Myxozyma melibiosi]|uniref:Nuclear condensing complex subunit n=1 Tax=Myxozyma melibiosi TaxID=54550 RepID=A0ABR1F9A7_9ASCO